MKLRVGISQRKQIPQTDSGLLPSHSAGQMGGSNLPSADKTSPVYRPRSFIQQRRISGPDNHLNRVILTKLPISGAIGEIWQPTPTRAVGPYRLTT